VLFVAGYGAVWMLAGVAAYGVVEGIRALHPHALGWSSAGRYVAGGGVAAAGLYQLTAVKRRWLARCTAPDLPVPGGGSAAALRAGIGHGGCCVACCWTLMAALYALGMMSLTWMAVVTVLIVSERVLRAPAVAVRGVAAVLIVLGVAVPAAPGSLPGLRIPSTAPRAMSAPAMSGVHDDARPRRSIHRRAAPRQPGGGLPRGGVLEKPSVPAIAPDELEPDG
jgi:hypothetical protein